MSVSCRLKATKIISQRKAFYRQKISEYSYPRKETVDIEILVTFRNGNSIEVNKPLPSPVHSVS